MVENIEKSRLLQFCDNLSILLEHSHTLQNVYDVVNKEWTDNLGFIVPKLVWGNSMKTILDAKPRNSGTNIYEFFNLKVDNEPKYRLTITSSRIYFTENIENSNKIKILYDKTITK